MKRSSQRRLIPVVAAAVFLGMTAGSSVTLASDHPAEFVDRTPAQAPAVCGQLDGPVFGLGDSVDPVAFDTFSVAGVTYESADFSVATLAVFELAWTARADVCIDRDDAGRPVAASAEARACGDVLIGATTWLYRVGPAGLDANGQTRQRLAFIHDTVLGFTWLDFSADPAPPNFLTILKIAAIRPNDEDCIDASVSWMAPSDPVVTASMWTVGCLVAGVIDDRTASFSRPDEGGTYTFTLSPGSTITPVFDPGELAGLHVTVERGIDGRVTISPIWMDGCPDAYGGVPYSTSTPTPTATVEPQASALSPRAPVGATPSSSAATWSLPSAAPTASPLPPMSVEATEAAGGIVAGVQTTRPSALDEGTQAAASSGLPVVSLVLAALLVMAAGGMYWQFVVRGRRR